MTTTELITPPRAPRPPGQRESCSDVRAAASEDRSFRDMVLETVTLISVVPLYGPPALVLAGPLVLFALMVAGAFTALLTLAVLLVAAAGLVGLIGAILALPYLLVRRLREHRAGQARSKARAAHLVPVDWRRVVA